MSCFACERLPTSGMRATNRSSRSPAASAGTTTSTAREPTLRRRGEDDPGTRDVVRDRTAKRVRVSEPRLAAQPLDDVDAQPRAVEVTAEIEEVNLDRPPLAAERRPHADVE